MTAVNYPPAPEGMCIYAVGDIHGRADLLEHIHRRIDADCDPALTNLEIYLGDYIDRGDRSKDVIETLIQRERIRNLICLRGNHEQMLLDFLEGADVPFLENGGVSTLLSYGVDPTQAHATLQRETKKEIPDAHMDFVKRSRLYFQAGPYIFVHAGIRPGIEISRQKPNDLMWIRDDFLNAPADPRFVVVHGHTPVDEPDFQKGRINIDTGAYITNCLTCLRISHNGVEYTSLS